MPKSKLVITITTYARGWTLANPEIDHGLHANATGPSVRQSRYDEEGKLGYFAVSS